MAGRVLGITYINENAALWCATLFYCRELKIRFGYQAEPFDAAAPGAMEELYRRIEKDDFEFCFGVQGVGSTLTARGRNVWAIRRTPFVGIHYDHPCHNVFNHTGASPYVANLYGFDSHLDVHRRYIHSPQLVGSIPFQILGAPPHVVSPFRDRPIKILYMKTGESLEPVLEAINGSPLKEDLLAMLDRAMNDPDLSLCDMVQDIFERRGMERTSKADLFWNLVSWADLYLRRKRAVDFVNWLKFQEGAVIVGQGWDFIDKTGARAAFKPGISAVDSYRLYQQTQFIANTTPYGCDLIHERPMLGLLNRCCVITDRNAWWSKHFGHIPAVTLYDTNQPLDEQIAPALSHCEKAAGAAQSGLDAARRIFTGQPMVQKIIECAAAARRFAEKQAA